MKIQVELASFITFQVYSNQINIVGFSRAMQ